MIFLSRLLSVFFLKLLSKHFTSERLGPAGRHCPTTGQTRQLLGEQTNFDVTVRECLVGCHSTASFFDCFVVVVVVSIARGSDARPYHWLLIFFVKWGNTKQLRTIWTDRSFTAYSGKRADFAPLRMPIENRYSIASLHDDGSTRQRKVRQVLGQPVEEFQPRRITLAALTVGWCAACWEETDKQWHRSGPQTLKSPFYSAHLNLHTFIDNLLKAPANTCIRLRSLDKPEIVRKNHTE